MTQFTTVAPSAADLNNQYQTSGENSAVSDAAPQVHPVHDSNTIAANPAVMRTTQASLMQDVTPATTKKSHRHELISLLAAVHSDIEVKASAAINAKHRHQYQGTFEVRFNMPSEVTAKTVSVLAANGAVFFKPDATSDNALFEKLCKTDGVLNLSALTSRSKRPANIDEAPWQKLSTMRDDISVTLYNEGLAPIHALINQALAVHGMAGPKVSKKLRANNLPDTSDKHAAMCAALKHLSVMLSA
jgi:hypothetical protein